MIYKDFGDTGIKASAVGFGGMRFDITKTDAENSLLLDYARDKGINFFDTAPMYCEDHSHDIFGLFNERNKAVRESYYMSSKLMPEAVTTAAEAIEKVDAALSRLKTDYLDFFYVWCIRQPGEFEDAMRPDGLIEGLERCKEQGKIRHINISSHLRGNRLKAVLRQRKFAGILIGLNILNFPYRWSAVEAACASGGGVVAMNPLAGGTIPKHADKFKFIAREGETVTEAALRFCISCPEITVALNGFTTTQHIDTACAVADKAQPFSAEEREAIKQQLDDNLVQMCTACGYCDKDCPKKIPISSYMQFYNEQMLDNATAQAMAEKMKFEYKWGALADRHNEAKDCIRCKRCNQACTQHIDIIARLAEIAEWQGIMEQGA